MIHNFEYDDQKNELRLNGELVTSETVGSKLSFKCIRAIYEICLKLGTIKALNFKIDFKYD